MLYIQTCIIGLAILLIPLLNRQRGFGRDRVLYRAVIIVTMLDLLLETTGWLLNGKVFSYAKALIVTVNTFTLLLQPVIGLLWLYYVFEKIGISLQEKPSLHLMCAAPLVINGLLLATNPWTHAILQVNAGNCYVRGDYLLIYVILSLLYPVSATGHALIFAWKTKDSAQRRAGYVLASFLLPPLFATLLQMLFYGTFLMLIGVSISLLIVFINIQNEQITVDFLTKVNNRASFITYAERKIRSVKHDCALYLFMIDVDSFKRINDTYGHVIGDQVLIAVAEQLKKACSGQSCFLARLGGDEFGILLECEQSETAVAFSEGIRTIMDEFNSDSSLAPITLSIGYTMCGKSETGIDQLLTRADAMMYNQKVRRHLRERFK